MTIRVTPDMTETSIAVSVQSTTQFSYAEAHACRFICSDQVFLSLSTLQQYSAIDVCVKLHHLNKMLSIFLTSNDWPQLIPSINQVMKNQRKKQPNCLLNMLPYFQLATSLNCYIPLHVAQQIHFPCLPEIGQYFPKSIQNRFGLPQRDFITGRINSFLMPNQRQQSIEST